MAAKKEADAVAVIKEACMADARRIAGEKGDAEEDLAQAKPFLEEAERAVESIKVPNLDKAFSRVRACVGYVANIGYEVSFAACARRIFTCGQRLYTVPAAS